MKKLNYGLRKMVNKNRDGSYGTRAERNRSLQLIAKQLDDLGFKNMTVSSLKTKHIWALVRYWQSTISEHTGKTVSNGTIKNRMSALRWWSEKIGKQNIIPRRNKDLGINNRQRLPATDKAFQLTDEQKEDLPRYLNLSARLQEEFGLRREEAAKFTLSKAEYEDHVKLVASWTKGGRARSIPILNDRQRALLEEIRAYAPQRSLIPSRMNYDQYLSHRNYILAASQVPPTHGLRYHYAQQRYLELTNRMKPPRLGGKSRGQLDEKEKALDEKARLVLSGELGHSRIDITRHYLG